MNSQMTVLGTMGDDATAYVRDINIFSGTLNLVGNGTATATVKSHIDGGLLVDSGTLNLKDNAQIDIDGFNDINNQAASISHNASLTGWGTINMTSPFAVFNNQGIIAPGSGGDPFKELTIVGHYHALSGGRVDIGVALGDDNSAHGQLTIDGTFSGTGTNDVKINNINGLGGMALNGIPVIKVTDGGLSATDMSDTFRLMYDYQRPDGTVAVIGGTTLYEFVPRFDGTDWWMVLKTIIGPDGNPVDNPVIPLYEAYPAIMMQLNRMGTMQQRVGNRSWVRTAASAGDREEEPRGVWLRLEGQTGRYKPKSSYTDARYDLDYGQFRFGIDLPVYQTDNDSMLVLGLSAHAGKGDADIKSQIGKGRIDVDALGMGAGLTWYDQSGFYTDLQFKSNWFKSDIRSSSVTQSYQARDNEGFGWAAGLEVGKEWRLSNRMTMTPQAQLVYSKLDFDDFVDIHNVSVSLDKNDSLEGRLGVAFNYEHNDPGDSYRLHSYVIPNVYYEFLDGAEVNIAGLGYHNKGERLWGGLSVGGTLDWNEDMFSVYGEVTARTGLEDFGNSREFAGELGFRINF